MRIDELRSNPERNPKVSIIDVLAKYRKRNDVYISFTALEKLGVNPSSSYSTPLGIYAYPLKQIWDEYVEPSIVGGRIRKTLDGVVPFAGDQPHVFIFSCPKQEGLITDFTRYTRNDLNRDLEKLAEVVAQYNEKQGKPSTIEYARGLVAFWHKQAKTASRDKSSFGFLWYITYRLATELSVHKNVNHDRAGAVLVDKAAPRVWNALLRRIGFIGFADKRGMGIIHKNEPIQAVFLTTEHLNIIGAYSNKVYDQSLNDAKRNQGLVMTWFLRNFVGNSVGLVNHNDEIVARDKLVDYVLTLPSEGRLMPLLAPNLAQYAAKELQVPYVDALSIISGWLRDEPKLTSMIGSEWRRRTANLTN